jgi:RNA-directed DNA polymerase
MNVQNNSEKNMVEWKDIPWKKIQRAVFRLQKRIYQASKHGDVKCVHKLQKLLLNSQSAKLLAVRKVTQDNSGKLTAVIDGIKSLKPVERLQLAQNLKIESKAKPVRRVLIPKPNKTEKRPLGIPTMRDRASQALVKLALEPEWEAKFEPNSFGFRPNRCTQDAIEAIFIGIHQKTKYVLDADIEGCFDNINHEYLLDKLNCPSNIRKQVKAWLKAGILDNQGFLPSDSGTPQGGVISPLLANIALHGLENLLYEWAKTWKGGKRANAESIAFIRYADDFVFLHESLDKVKEAKTIIEEFLKPVGLKLKESKTKICHTTEGFDFLGFNIQSNKLKGYHNSGKNSIGGRLGFKTIIQPSKEAIKRHYDKLTKIIDRHKSSTTSELIKELNPVITGWCNYYQWVCSKVIFGKLDHMIWIKLWAWCKRRHSNKNTKWIKNKYFKRLTFAVRGKIVSREWQLSEDDNILFKHSDTQVKTGSYVKVKSTKSPFDGDLKYWGTRGKQLPGVPSKLVKLLKKQKGKCAYCGQLFIGDDLIELDHIIPQSLGGSHKTENRQALHKHCHDNKTRYDRSNDPRKSSSTYEKGQIREERNEVKVSRSVLKTNGFRKESV